MMAMHRASDADRGRRLGQLRSVQAAVVGEIYELYRDNLVMMEPGNGASEQLPVGIEFLIALLENHDMLQG